MQEIQVDKVEGKVELHRLLQVFCFDDAASCFETRSVKILKMKWMKWMMKW